MLQKACFLAFVCGFTCRSCVHDRGYVYGSVYVGVCAFVWGGYGVSVCEVRYVAMSTCMWRPGFNLSSIIILSFTTFECVYHTMCVKIREQLADRVSH